MLKIDPFFRLYAQQRWAIVLSVILSLPIFRVGVVMDDYVHRLILRGAIPTWSPNPTRLYDFTRTPGEMQFAMEHGMFPWWTADDFRIRFFRPLSSALVAFDHLFDGYTTVVGHSQNILWFVALAWLAASIVKAILPEKFAVTATWCFVLAAHHSSGLQWVAARNSLVAGVFGLLSVALFAKRLQQLPDVLSGPAVGVPSAFALFVGLFAGETALASIILLFAIDCLLRPASALMDRAQRLSVPITIGVLYLVLYSLAGYGVRSSGIYHDPVREFAAYSADFSPRMAGLLADPLSSIPADFLMFGGVVARNIARIGGVTLGVFALWLLVLRARLEPFLRRVVLVMLVASFIALVPSVAGAPGGRMLPLVGLCLATVVGVALRQSAIVLRSEVGLLSKALVVPFFCLFAFMQFVVGPMLRVGQPLNMARISVAQRAIGHQTEWQCNPRSVMIVLASSDPAVAMYVLPLLADAGHLANVGQVLSMAPTDHFVEGVDDHTFKIRSTERVSILNNPLGILYRAPAMVVSQGFVRRFEGLRLSVTQANEAGPMELTVHTTNRIASPDVCVFQWKNGALRPFVIPPSGQIVRVIRELGPMGL